MTRTEFILLAVAMRATRPFPNGHTPQIIAQHNQWERDCTSIATHIKRVNPAFDVVMFLANCKEAP